MDFWGYIIPVVSVFLSYFLGRLQSKNTNKFTAAKERYEKFYVPFVQKLYAGFMWEQPFSSLSKDLKQDIFDMLIGNIQFMDEKAQSFFPAFYEAYLDLLTYEPEDFRYKDALKTAEFGFYDITGAVLSESSRLSKELNLPNIGHTFEKRFSGSLEEKLSKVITMY